MALLNLGYRYDHGASPAYYLSGVGAVTAVCLLSKEAGVACFLVPLLFAVFRPFPDVRPRRSGHGCAAVVAVGLTALYLVMRHLLGIRSAGAANGYYSLSFGTNLLTNAGLGLMALLNPVSTVRVVLDGWFWKGLAAAWVLLLLGLAVFALRTTRRSPPWRAILLLLSVTVIAQGPVLLMPHLTEANFTRSLAPGLLALALCLQPWWEAARDPSAWRRRLVFLLQPLVCFRCLGDRREIHRHRPWTIAGGTFPGATARARAPHDFRTAALCGGGPGLHGL